MDKAVIFSFSLMHPGPPYSYLYVVTLRYFSFLNPSAPSIMDKFDLVGRLSTVKEALAVSSREEPPRLPLPSPTPSPKVQSTTRCTTAALCGSGHR